MGEKDQLQVSAKHREEAGAGKGEIREQEGGE